MNERPTIVTERLLLRPFELSDAPDVQRLAGDKAIADTTLNIPHPYEDGMAEEWILTHQPKFEAGELVNFAIVLRTTGKLIGAIGLAIVRRFERAELGYWIGKPYWNNGYCTEAGRAVLRYSFSVLKLNRVHASHLTRNPASGRVMQKIGMTREGCARQHVKRWDRFEDLELYGILREGWIRNTKEQDRGDLYRLAH
ncbi:GNAT family N-acetyltransferase [Candidatus Acetothermia bacterium]|jgi:RimJ/RimL family protein N-acetyltransferase|nr:GNAT family N-acetyltransferase [Candidatus Acetothermia bacterium]MCI2427103.1 GNAT family N-acetyltransferase [Candidatus Acetothermia bacterium]MCI2428845.1 GNAT family N-acetyltransferase [Candidatus Acetothermia bacterium]